MRRDVKIFSIHYKIAIYLGIVSSYRDQPESRIKKIAYKLPLAALFTFYIVIAYFCLRERVKVNQHFSSSTVIAVDVLQGIAELLFAISCILLTELRRKNWKNCVQYLDNIENELNEKYREYYGKEGNFFRYVLVKVSCVLLFLAAHLAELAFLNLDDVSANYYYLNFRIFFFINEYFMVLQIHNIGKILERRYDVLNKLLEDVKKDAEKAVEGRLVELNVLYKALYDLTNEFNAVLGWPVLFLLFITITTIVNYLNGIFLYENLNSDNMWTNVVINTAYACLYMTFTAVIVMSCDAVEKTGGKFTTICYLLQEGMMKSPMRDELQYLSQFSEKLNPKFSAAGFYRVNQLIMAGLFSTATTYSIICIQFNYQYN